MRRSAAKREVSSCRRRCVAQIVVGFCLVALGPATWDCTAGLEPEEVDISSAIDDQSSSLSVPTVQWVNGTYGAGCVARSGSWSLRVAGVVAMDYPSLSVVRNDAGCALTLSSVVAEGTTYVATPSLTLSSSYPASASAFGTGGGAVSFYGSAKLSSVSFGSSAVVSLLLSDDVRAGAASASVTREAHLVGGSVAGLVGSGLVLRNGSDALSVLSNGTFTMAAAVSRGASFNVTVDTQPSAAPQVCGVTGGSGTMGGTDVTSVRITCAPTSVAAGAVVTFVGRPAGTDGFGAIARFDGLGNLALGPSGNLYVPDINNHRIRVVSPAGLVTTLAGSTLGYSDGTGVAAQFNYPSGVAVSAAGDVTVADTYNHRIRTVTSAGVVSTLAGSGTAAFANGTGAAASFDSPLGVALDGSGTVYVADWSNDLIRAIAPNGTVTTFAGSGTAPFTDGASATAGFSGPNGLAFDAAGTLFVADQYNFAVRAITPGGFVSTFAGTNVSGYTNDTGASARFGQIQGLSVDAAGNLYVGDTQNHAIRKVTAASVVTTLAGSGAAGFSNGTGTAAQFYNPSGTAVDGSGTVYVADSGNNRVRKVTAAGVVTSLAGSSSAADGTGLAAAFRVPWGIVQDSAGNLYVADYGNSVIRKISTAGVVSTLAGSGVAGYADGTGTAARFNGPGGLAIDASSTVYVADCKGHRIRKVTSAGVVTTLAGSGVAGFADGTGTAAQFNAPNGLALDSAGNVFVADYNNNRIRKITPAGVVTTFAGQAASGTTNATGTSAKFKGPTGIQWDSVSGNFYVADFANNRIRQITSGAAVTTFAGSTVGYLDATGVAAKFNLPYDVALDSAGNLYVADYANNRIRKITPGKVVTTVAGSGARGLSDGTGNAAVLSGPAAIAIAANGDLYFAEQDNDAIRKVVTSGSGRLGVSWRGSYDSDNVSLLGQYTATATAAGYATQTCSVSDGSQSCTFTGLTSGVTYTVTVTATDAAGATSPASSPVTAAAL